MFAVPNVNVLLYADDLKMFLAVENSNYCEILQDSVNRFLTWCHDNEMFVNVQKCNYITFSKKRIPITFNYTIGQDSVPRSSVARDLGIMLDSKLILSCHFHTIVSKALNMLGLW